MKLYLYSPLCVFRAWTGAALRFYLFHPSQASKGQESKICKWKYINNCATRCTTKQSIYYSASSLYMFRVSTTPINRSTQNCNYNLRYWSYFLCSCLPPTWPLIIFQWDATQSNLFIFLQVHYTCFRCQPRPSTGVHKTVTMVSNTRYIFCASTSCRVNLQNNKYTALCCISLDNY